MDDKATSALPIDEKSSPDARHQSVEERASSLQASGNDTIEDENEPVPTLHAKTWLAVFSVVLVYFAQLINVVGAGAQTQSITAVIGGSSQGVWLTQTITISTVVLSPIVSQAADYWGRRWLLIGLTFCGCIGSIIIARADSIGMAIAGFAVTGLSYGAQPLVHTVTSEILPRRYRPWAQAFSNASAASGGLVALLAGGALTRHNNFAGFRNYWYMAMAIYLLATIGIAALYNPPPRPEQTRFTMGEKLAKLDWVGYLLLLLGLVLFCMGLAWSQNPYPWSDAHTSATFALGCAISLGLVAYETLVKKDGMFHHGLFSSGRNFPIALFAVFVEGLVFFAANNYFAFQVSVLYETDSLRTGARYGVMMIVYGISAVLAGLYCSTTKVVRWPTVTAFGFIIVFFICMATTTPSTSSPVWGYPVFLGIGLGICLCALVTVAQLSTPRELIAATTGLMIGVRSLGGTVGLAIYNAIFNKVLGDNLGSRVAAAVIPLKLPPTSIGPLIGGLTTHNTAAVMKVPGVTPDIIHAAVGALLESFSLAFRYVWISAGCLTVLAFVASFFLIDPKKEFNMHIDAPAEKEEDLYASR